MKRIHSAIFYIYLVILFLCKCVCFSNISNEKNSLSCDVSKSFCWY